MYTYDQLLSNHCGFKINYEMWYIQHCGHYAGCLVFDIVSLSTKNII